MWPRTRGVITTLCVACTVLASAGSLAAQDPPLPASATPPPDVLERQRMQPPTAAARLPQHPASTQEPPDAVERRRLPAPPGGAGLLLHAAATQEPPDVAEQRRASAPPPPPARSPTLNELLDLIRARPDGPGILDRARRGGARIPSPLEGPIGVWLGGGPDAGYNREHLPSETLAQQATSMKVTLDAPQITVSGLGSLSAYAYWSYTQSVSVWGPLIRFTTSNHWLTGGSHDVHPFFVLYVNVTTAGYHLINVVATGVAAELRKSTTTSPYPILSGGQWDNSSTTGYISYPIVLNLAAGMHYFYWLPNTPRNVYVLEASVTKLP